MQGFSQHLETTVQSCRAKQLTERIFHVWQ